MNSLNENEIKSVLTSITECADAKNKAIYNKALDTITMPEFKGPEEFYYALIYPYNNFISGFLTNEMKLNREQQFIYTDWNFLNNHFRELFRKYEGSACCADKSKTILRRLAQFFQDGKEIEFDHNDEYSFGYPERIFQTHKSIIDFFYILRSLKSGHTNQFVKVLAQMEYDMNVKHHGDQYDV